MALSKRAARSCRVRLLRASGLTTSTRYEACFSRLRRNSPTKAMTCERSLRRSLGSEDLSRIRPNAVSIASDWPTMPLISWMRAAICVPTEASTRSIERSATTSAIAGVAVESSRIALPILARASSTLPRSDRLSASSTSSLARRSEGSISRIGKT